MTDPTLLAELAKSRAETEKARAETDATMSKLDELEDDLEAVKSADRVRAMALGKLRADWEYLKDRLHEVADKLHKLANRYVELQERHLILVEGAPPPAETPTAPKDKP